jgi:hypothetical protein
MRYLEIVFHDAINEGDLEILVEATPERMGRVRLRLAFLEPPRPEAPNAQRLLSHNGRAMIGFVAEAELAEPPYHNSYWLDGEPGRG